MIARGFILLGFGPSNIRTRHESLEEEDTLLAFEKVRAPEDYRSSEAYHFIFDFLSEDISILHREGGEELAFIFCTVVMIVAKSLSFSKRKYW